MVPFTSGVPHIETNGETNEAFKRIGAKLWSKHHPRCKQFQFDIDEYWECHIQHNTLITYHPIGTCKMGSKEDNNSMVVDPQLR